jgi:hypothetical protein
MIKLSILRQFGSEQFSITAELDKNAGTKEVSNGVTLMGHAVSEAFKKVVEREETEKLFLIEASKKRQDANKALEDQLKDEMRAANNTAQTVHKAEKLNK